MKLERIPLELLIFMIERPGQLLTRDDIAVRLWKEAVHVDVDSGVKTAIRKLRAALQDSPVNPAFIETVLGKGYRFIGSAVQADDSPEPIPRKPPGYARHLAVVGIITAAFALYFGVNGPQYASAGRTPVTIVVLPFQNMNSQPDLESFVDGMTEETIAALSRVSLSGIRVIARTSSMAYKGTHKTARDVAKDLGANYLIESTVRRKSDQVRITSRLIRAEDQVLVWSKAYDQDLSGIYDVQRKIGAAIAMEVGAMLSPNARQSGRIATLDPDAH